MDIAREFSTKQRERLAKSGKALPDGSFPIANVSDLKNAIQAYGRAKNKSRAKAHIKKRARALGKTDLLPDGWKSKDSAMYSCEECDRSGFLTEQSLSDHAEAVHTFSEIEELVRVAVMGVHGPRCYVRDIADDYVVIRKWSRYDEVDDPWLLKIAYSIDDAGSVTLGESEQVRTKVSYPAAPTESASLASDLPHEFGQDEGSHPFFCSDCGRSKPHPVHNDGRIAVRNG